MVGLQNAKAWAWRSGVREDIGLPPERVDRLAAAEWGLVAWDSASGKGWRQALSPSAGTWEPLEAQFVGAEAACHRPAGGLLKEAVLIWTPERCSFIAIEEQAVDPASLILADGLPTESGRCAVPRPAALAFDPLERKLLAAVPDSHQLFAVYDQAQHRTNVTNLTNSLGVQDYDGPSEALAGEQRVLVLGDSMIFFFQSRGRSYPKRMEAELNRTEALAGTGKRWRVAGRGTLGSAMGGGIFSFSAQTPEQDLAAFGPQWVVLGAHSLNLAMDVLAFGRTAVKDDVAVDGVDPETALLPLEDRPLGPNAKSLLGWALRHSDKVKKLFPRNDQGELRFNEFAPIGEYRAILNAPENKTASKAILRKALAAADARISTDKRRLVVLLQPMRQDLSQGETFGGSAIFWEQGLGDALPLLDWAKEICAELGIAVVDLRPAMRLLSPASFPIYLPGDMHLSEPGAEALGRILAEELRALSLAQHPATGKLAK